MLERTAVPERSAALEPTGGLERSAVPEQAAVQEGAAALELTAAPERSEQAPRNQRMAQLLMGARAGRRECLEQIVVELSPLLWHVARAQGLDQESAQDAVQHTWLKLLTQLEQIRNPLALSAWLVTTAKRKAWRLRAAQRTEPPTDTAALPDPVDALPGPEEKVLLCERQREVWQAVHRLPGRCQELLRVVAFVQRPDYDQVAVALGMPRGSIGPTRGRCLAKLRILLEAEPEGSTA